jgi:hypothetical protein
VGRDRRENRTCAAVGDSSLVGSTNQEVSWRIVDNLANKTLLLCVVVLSICRFVVLFFCFFVVLLFYCCSDIFQSLNDDIKENVTV